MDYRALTTLRDLLETYALAVQKAPNKPNTPSVPRELRHATKALPGKEIIRELETLPNNIIRPLIIRDVCEPPSLRRAVLRSSLFSDPKYNNPRNKRKWYRALGNVIDTWEALETDDSDEYIIGSLRKLRKRVEDAVSPDKADSLSLATLLVTADARLQKVEQLQQNINDAVALLEKGQLAYAHDGLQEVVESLWAQVRSEYSALSQIVSEGEKIEGPERDVVITRVESVVAQLRAKHTMLIGLAFQLPRLEVARGEGRERADEDDEDEWEDAWEDGCEEPVRSDDHIPKDIDDTHDVGAERATAKPDLVDDKIESFLKGRAGKSSKVDEVELPPIVDVGNGKEADKFNRLLLDRLEEKAAVQMNGEGTGSSFSGAVGRGRDKGRGTGLRGGKKAANSAQKRISAALGIKKRKKKKSLLD